MFEINAIVNRDTRLQMRDVDERVLYITGDALCFINALMSRARRPTFDPQKNDHHNGRDDYGDEGPC